MIHRPTRLMLFACLGMILIVFGAVRFWPGDPPPQGNADRLVVLKSERKLLLMRGTEVLKTYRVVLGRNAVGPKIQAGDHKTPEGTYILDYRNPTSRFFFSMHVSYPNTADQSNARKLGVAPGGDIMVHGLPNGLGWLGRWHRMWDWTDGCVAVTNEEMDEIRAAVRDGTPIEIRP